MQIYAKISKNKIILSCNVILFVYICAIINYYLLV